MKSKLKIWKKSASLTTAQWVTFKGFWEMTGQMVLKRSCTIRDVAFKYFLAWMISGSIIQQGQCEIFIIHFFCDISLFSEDMLIFLLLLERRFSLQMSYSVRTYSTLIFPCVSSFRPYACASVQEKWTEFQYLYLKSRLVSKIVLYSLLL